MSAKKPALPRGIPVKPCEVLICGDARYGVQGDPAEPEPPGDPDFEKRVQEELFRAIPVSPIVN